MMSVQTVHCEDATRADQEAVWRLLGDSATWPAGRYRRAHCGRAPGADGTGESASPPPAASRFARIVDRRAPDRLRYALLGGLAVRDYRAHIDLEPTSEGGTHIRWDTCSRR